MVKHQLAQPVHRGPRAQCRNPVPPHLPAAADRAVDLCGHATPHGEHGRAIWRFAAEPGLTTIAAVIGLETWLAFHRSTDLPEFAAFPLLDDPDGRELLAEYFRDHLRIAAAAAAGTGVVLEAPTWRANFDWGTPTRLMTPPRSTGAIAIQWRSCGASRGAPGDRSHRNGGTKAEMREDAVLPVGAGRTRQGAGGRTLPSGLDETAPGRRRKPSGGWSSCSPRGAGPRQLGGGAIPIRHVAGPARRVNIEGLRVEIGSKRVGGAGARFRLQITALACQVVRELHDRPGL